MTYTLAEIDWFDIDGWSAHLERWRRDPASPTRDRQIATVEDHLAILKVLTDTPENRPRAPSLPCVVQ